MYPKINPKETGILHTEAVDYGGCDYGGFYGECDYGGCVSVRVWHMG